jgi:hypothetical protein
MGVDKASRILFSSLISSCLPNAGLRAELPKKKISAMGNFKLISPANVEQTPHIFEQLALHLLLDFSRCFEMGPHPAGQIQTF